MHSDGERETERDSDIDRDRYRDRYRQRGTGRERVERERGWRREREIERRDSRMGGMLSVMWVQEGGDDSQAGEIGLR